MYLCIEQNLYVQITWFTVSKELYPIIYLKVFRKILAKLVENPFVTSPQIKFSFALSTATAAGWWSDDDDDE